jgi:hypothetical protein
MRRIGAVLGAVIAIGLAASASSVQAGPVRLPRPYCGDRAAVFRGHSRLVGVMDNEVVDQSAYLDCTLGIAAHDGIGVYRTPMLWQYIETAPGVYDWSTTDGLMSAFARHRIAWLPILLGAPSWDREPKSADASPGAYQAPASDAPFAQFAAAAVRRYGPGGAFWIQHPGLPRVPIRAWQIWNEPNFPFYWQPAPNAAAYTRLLRAGYRAIKRLDRHADVLTAGMAFSAQGIPVLSYYREMFRAHAKGSFDTVAMHPYAPTAQLAIERIQSIRTLADRFHDRRAGVWVTEFGWSSGGPPSPYRAPTAAVQARRTGVVLGWLVRHRSELRLRGIVYPLWRDEAPGAGSGDYWGLHVGLLSIAGTAKPVFGALMAAARKLDG